MNCKKSFQASGLLPGKGKSKDGEKGKEKGKAQEKGKPSKGKGKTNKGAKGKKGGKGKKGEMYELTENPQDHQEAADEEHWGETWWDGAGGDAWGEENWAGYVLTQDSKAAETPFVATECFVCSGFSSKRPWPEAWRVRCQTQPVSVQAVTVTCCAWASMCVKACFT